MVIYIIILAIVQGLTEFLPVSSSGHLVLLNLFFGIKSDFLLLSILLHLATLFSVAFVLRKSVLNLIKHPFGKDMQTLFIATVPTVIIVLLFKDFFSGAFDGRYLPFCFMLTAVIISLSELLRKRSSGDGKVDKKTASVMGIFQGLAVLPGVSRSGATMCAGLASGKDRVKVTEFSFLMSVPIILASMALEIYEYSSSGAVLQIMWYELAVGFLVAFIVGIFAVKFMLRLVEKHSLLPFAVYLFVLSILSFFCIF